MKKPKRAAGPPQEKRVPDEGSVAKKAVRRTANKPRSKGGAVSKKQDQASLVGEATFPEYVVVGIGASAGGLAAFKEFLEAVPCDTGMAFVLVQHLDPNRESMMVDLLPNYTRMPVLAAEDAMPIRPDHVYVIPPNKFLKIRDGGLFLDEPIRPNGARLPIDYFFRSLADQRHERAVGVILSGTGGDGALGLRAIKEQGGMVMVQEAGTAAYDGMPRSALATGLVDFELPIQKMPEAIMRYIRHPYVDGEPPDLSGSTGYFNSIINILRAQTDYDFRCYKRGTLSRRIQRRMGLRHMSRIEDYLKLLRTDRDETKQLFNDLLISVTAFLGSARRGMSWRAR